MTRHSDEPVPVSAASAASTPNAGHTPLPWAYTASGCAVEREVELYDCNLEGNFGLYVYNLTDGVTLTEQDAAFIVRACNSHYDLLEALSRYVSCCGNTAAMVDRESVQEAYRLAQAALAKATGK